jgi:hypothetical protein
MGSTSEDVLFPTTSLTLLERDARWRPIPLGEGRELVGELTRGLNSNLIDNDDRGGEPVHPWLAGSRVAAGARS